MCQPLDKTQLTVSDLGSERKSIMNDNHMLKYADPHEIYTMLCSLWHAVLL